MARLAGWVGPGTASAGGGHNPVGRSSAKGWLQGPRAEVQSIGKNHRSAVSKNGADEIERLEQLIARRRALPLQTWKEYERMISIKA